MRIKLADCVDTGADVPRPEPFVIELRKGKVVTLPHPADMQVALLLSLDVRNPVSVLRALLGDETLAALASEKRVTVRVLEKIVNAWVAHYGLLGALTN